MDSEPLTAEELDALTAYICPQPCPCCQGEGAHGADCNFEADCPDAADDLASQWGCCSALEPVFAQARGKAEAERAYVNVMEHIGEMSFGVDLPKPFIVDGPNGPTAIPAQSATPFYAAIYRKLQTGDLGRILDDERRRTREAERRYRELDEALGADTIRDIGQRIRALPAMGLPGVAAVLTRHAAEGEEAPDATNAP